MVLVLPSVLFLSFRNSSNIAIIFIALMIGRSTCIWAVTYFAGSVYNKSQSPYLILNGIVYKEIKQKSDEQLPLLLFVSLVLLIASQISYFYGVYFNWPQYIMHISNAAFAVSSVLSIACFLFWLRITLKWSRERNAESLSIDECTCITYFVSSILFPLAIVFWRVVNDDFSWSELKENTLIFIIAMNLFFTVAVTGAQVDLDTFLNSCSHNTLMQSFQVGSSELWR